MTFLLVNLIVAAPPIHPEAAAKRQWTKPCFEYNSGNPAWDIQGSQKELEAQMNGFLPVWLDATKDRQWSYQVTLFSGKRTLQLEAINKAYAKNIFTIETTVGTTRFALNYKDHCTILLESFGEGGLINKVFVKGVKR